MAKGQRVPTAKQRAEEARDKEMRERYQKHPYTKEGQKEADREAYRKREQPSEYEHKRWMEEYHRRAGRAGKK